LEYIRQYIKSQFRDSDVELFKKILIYGGGNMAAALSAILLLPVYLRNMSMSEYGMLSLSLMLPVVLSPFMSLLLEGSVMRLYYEWQKKGRERKSIFTIWIFMSLWGAIITILFLMFGGTVSALFLRNLPFSPYIEIAILTAYTTVNYNFVGKILRIQEKPLQFVLLNISSVILRVLFIIIFVAVYKLNAIGALYGILITNVLMLVPCVFIILKNSEIKLDMVALKESLTLELPSMPGEILLTITSILDRVILDKFVGNVEIGIYAVAKKIASVSSMFFTVFQLALAPHYIKLNDNDKLARFKIKRLNNLFFNMAFICSISLMLFASELIFILGNAENYKVVKYVSIMVFAVYLEILLFEPNIQFLLGKKLKYGSYASLIKFLSTVVLCTISGFYYGLMGIIISIAFTNILVLMYARSKGESVYLLNNKLQTGKIIILCILALLIFAFPDIFTDLNIYSIFTKLIALIILITYATTHYNLLHRLRILKD
jgi:O-antigen/teichoic acid export membrane protein